MISENEIYGSARCNGNPIQCLRGESLPGMDEIFSAYGADSGPAIERPLVFRRKLLSAFADE